MSSPGKKSLFHSGKLQCASRVAAASSRLALPLSQTQGLTPWANDEPRRQLLVVRPTTRMNSAIVTLRKSAG